MGQKTSKRSPRDPRDPSGSAGNRNRRSANGQPLNNASVQEQEEQEWDRRVTVVATSPRCRNPEATPMAHTATMTRSDSFSRSLEHVYRGSLHKEVLYSAVNMSRKSSSDETDTPAGAGNFRRSRSRVFYDSHRTYHSPGASHAFSISPSNPKPLAPDRVYPKSISYRSIDFSRSPDRTPLDNTSQPTPNRNSNKAVNVNSCHSTIKNNNYLFVNNCRDIKEQSDQESLYRVYNVAEQTVTTTSPSTDLQKLTVDVQKDVKTNGSYPRQQQPKIVLTEQFIPVGDIQIFPLKKQELPSSQPSVVLQQNGHRKYPMQNGVMPNGHSTLRKDVKCSSSAVVSQNGNLKNGDCLKSTQKSASGETQETEKKGSSWWQRKFKTPCIGKHFIRPSKGTDQALPKTFVRSSSTSHRQQKRTKPQTGSSGHGPHTSTPKYGDKKSAEQTTPSTYNSLPNRGKYSLTPRRPPERLSVRRKLPYTEAAVTSNGNHTLSTGDVNLDLMSLSSSERELLGNPSEEKNSRVRHNSATRNGFHQESRQGEVVGNDQTFQGAVYTSKGAVQRKSFNLGVTNQRQLSLPEVRSINTGDTTLLADSRKVSSEPSISSSCENRRISEEKKEVPPKSGMEEAENLSFQIPEYSRRDVSLSSTSLWNSSISSIQKKDAPVLLWLKELRVLTDNECLNALQGKVLCKDQGMHKALSVGTAQEMAEMLKERCSLILNDLGRTAKALDVSDWHHFCSCAVDLCTGVKDFLKDYCSASGNNDHSTHKGEGDITDACAQLMHAVNSKNESGLQQKEKVIMDLESLKHSMLNLVDLLIMRQLTVIVDAVEESTNSNSLKRAIFALILLGQMGKTFCELIAKVGAIRSLLAVCIENRWRHLHASALRALTVISCVPSAIKSLEEAGGVECVTDILCDTSADEATRSEAAGLMAQVTAPWMDSTGFTLSSITGNGSKLIHALTDLAEHTKCSEVMLLASAALANLSFLDSTVCEWMKQHKTTSVLVAACRQGKVANSLFIKDQVATVLANMAASTSCQDEIDSAALILLLCFLQLRPSVAHSKPELAACERVQQKAAIALARLCSDVRTANTVAEMQGVQRLVRLCKDQKERNNSDSVLVACLAALRKIANVRGNEEFKSLGALELVEPRLWDTFLIYSSKQESYV